MSEQQTPRENLWQVLAPIMDDFVLQSLRDMDDPDAEVDQHDLDARSDYFDVVETLADWLVPEEPEPHIPDYPDCDDVAPWQRWRERQRLRQILLAEAALPEGEQ